MLLWQRAFEKFLGETLGVKPQLVWTNNRRVMISFKHHAGGTPVLRLHESFATAGDGVKEDLAEYLTGRRKKVPDSVKEFVRLISGHDADGKPSAERLTHTGENYDLKKIYQKLNKTYFGGLLGGRITWGRKNFAPKKKSLTFGTYNFKSGVIRIHPVLDTELVPLFYLESVVHHEMAHEYLHKAGNDGENSIAHSKRFRELEGKFKFYKLAMAWEKRHFARMLNYQPRPASPANKTKQSSNLRKGSAPKHSSPEVTRFTQA